ncbi:MAG: glycosyltransferase family 2 protein [Paludibacteraceae bacterium]
MSKISVITINYNNALGLEKTMQSVLAQNFDDYEYIVIDGASTDGSIEIIRKLELQVTYWISEPDSGIYNAMNKGIKKASGDFLLFLNSGDFFTDNEVLSDFVKVVKPQTELCSGNLWLSGRNGEEQKLTPPAELTLHNCIEKGLLHPATFIRRDLFHKYGLYNEQNRIVSDWEFFLLVGGLHSVNYQSIDRDIARFDTDGISSLNQVLLRKETKEVLDKLIPLPIRRDMERLSEFEKLANDKVLLNLDMVKQHKMLFRLLSFIIKVLSKFS